MPALHTPKFPVVDPQPGFIQAFKNFNFSDVASIGSFSLSGFAVGWFGASKHLRGQNSRFLLGVGLMSGVMFATQSSMQRLMGLEPNEREVKLYGEMSEQDLHDCVRRSNNPNVELIDAHRSK